MTVRKKFRIWSGPHLGKQGGDWRDHHNKHLQPQSRRHPQPTANLIAALPIGGRIKLEPWDNRLRMLKTKPVGMVAKDEVTPFELTPFFLYLTRQGDAAPQKSQARSL